MLKLQKHFSQVLKINPISCLELPLCYLSLELHLRLKSKIENFINLNYILCINYFQGSASSSHDSAHLLIHLVTYYS